MRKGLKNTILSKGKLLFIAFLCSVSSFLKAQDTIETLLKLGAEAQYKYQEITAIEYYKKILDSDSIHFKALYNISYLYQRQGWLIEDFNESKAKEYYTIFQKYADRIYRHYPNTFEGNIVKAGASARMAQYLDAKERVQAAWDIKKYADAAYKINPDNHDVLHMLAWWNYELTRPTWLERKLSLMFFGGLPTGASIEKAINFLQRAMKAQPNYLVHFYDMAIFLIGAGQKEKAIEYLNKALKMQPHSPEEVQYLALAKKKLSKING